MNFKRHSELIGKHALFGASQYAWLRYDEEKAIKSYMNKNATTIGTELHDFASNNILFLQKMPKTRKAIFSLVKNYLIGKYCSNREDFNYDKHVEYCKSLINGISRMSDAVFVTLEAYVNDTIGFRMTPEQPLVYSENFFGTTDAISFNNGLLRINDLKTGEMPAHIEQLRIYASLFCLEYAIKPADIEMELRIYQSGDVLIDNPTKDDILPIISKIISFDKMFLDLAEDK